VTDTAPGPVIDERPPWGFVLRRDRDRRLWDLVKAQRLAVADQILAGEPGYWDQPSRCDGWRVRDVMGHLVHMAESTRRSIGRDVRAHAGRDRDKGFALCARELGQRPVPELAQRLRRSARSKYNGMPAVALSEVVVHGDDMFQPVGQRLSVDGGALVQALKLMWVVDRLGAGFAFHGRAHRGVRLVATNVTWAGGRGPEVRGTALDLLALLTNRPVADLELSGPGVAHLARGGAPSS
jgi:uncharacterized protein (TIGR03083 family)